jgi:protease PrsW
MESLSISPIVYALLGGFIPPLIWLWFWLKEDSASPEPRGMIFFAFITGMIAVPLVIWPENLALTFFEKKCVWLICQDPLSLTVISWAAIEEITKFSVAYALILRSRFVDEPIDAVIYIITVALGFSALENMFFLLSPFGQGEFITGIITGNLRFIGATLLHTVSSASIGAGLALSFYKHKKIRLLYVFTGLIIAITLHSLFNLFIIKSGSEKLFFAFSGVWVSVVFLIFLFEKIKHIIKPIRN